MEILSPAGNKKHVDVAIDEKSNAVYGGLKKWNARNNAINLSIEEYNESIERLHKNEIKFYLTLNILMIDEEIADIIELFKSGKVILPDAFIVADLGLIIKLKKEFPNVPIHVSTQFGAHNLSDVNFLKKLGVSRVILARELTFNEVNKIKDNTEMELETFIWGSQCLSFSGLCFFGTFINGGSGNRGKCSIVCRDVYEVFGDKGTYLYVPDMNCINLTEKLDNIDSLKIEGRRRTEQELKKVIQDIRAKHTDDEQKGYLYGINMDANKMYEKVNHRLKPVYGIDELDSIDKNDIFVEFKNNMPYRFIDNPEKKNKNIWYVYSEYKNDYVIEKNNIFFVFDVLGECINKIDYTNFKGEFTSFNMNNEEDLIEITINDFVEIMNSTIPGLVNVYKVRYIRNKENKYMISRSMLESLKDFVKKDNSRFDNQKQKYKNSGKHKLKDIFIETDNTSVVDNFIGDKFVKIIYALECMEDFEIIESKYKDKVIYKLPLFNWDSIDYSSIFKKMKDKDVMFTRLSQLEESCDIEFRNKYIDYSIYCWNKETLAFLKKYNITGYTASPELSYEQNRKIFENNNVQYILAGKLPLVYTRACFKNVFNCVSCQNQKSNIKKIKNISKNLDFEITCKKSHRVITYSQPILNDYSKFNMEKNASYRYVAINDNLEEIKNVVNILKEENYMDKLLKTKKWCNSYEGNLVITRA